MLQKKTARRAANEKIVKRIIILQSVTLVANIATLLVLAVKIMQG